MLSDLPERRRNRKYLKREIPELDKDRKNAPRKEEITNSNDYTEEYLKNKNLSIMTDTEPDLDHNSRPLQKTPKMPNNPSRKIPNADTCDSFVVVIAKKKKPTISKWERVNKDNITECMKINSTTQKHCCLQYNTWYLKIKRRILKKSCNKIYPGVNG